MGSLTSDPRVPLPTREYTFLSTLGFPSFPTERLPHLTRVPPSQSGAPPRPRVSLLIVKTFHPIQDLPLPVTETSVLRAALPYGDIFYLNPGTVPAHRVAFYLRPWGAPAPQWDLPLSTQKVPLITSGPPLFTPLSPQSPQDWPASPHTSLPTPISHNCGSSSPFAGTLLVVQSLPEPLLCLRVGDQRTFTPWGFRDLSGDSPLSPAQTHTLPPPPPPPELPFESREPSHRATGSGLASGTEPGRGLRALTR